jgi:putative membrane protein
MIYGVGGFFPSLLSKHGAVVGRGITNNSTKPFHMSQALVNSIVYAFLGIGILAVTFILFELLTPKHNLRKEILENKNMALALLAGFFMLAVAIIIASAIH